MLYPVINKGDSKQTRVAKKRFKKRLKRRQKFYHKSVKFYKRAFKGKSQNRLHSRFKYSHELERFCEANYHLTAKTPKMIFKLNQEFSLFENPAKVLISLINLLHNARSSVKKPKVIYDGYVSFGAVYLIDNLCWEIGKRRRWLVDFVQFPDMHRSILSKLRSIISSSVDDEYEYLINERVLINRSSKEATANQRYKVVAKEITDMVEKAVGESMNNKGHKLSFEARGAIGSAIGEQFDNILLHAVEAEYGTVCGFYNKTSQELTILIYNFGKTIAETLSGENLPDEIYDQVIYVIEQHWNKKVLNFTRNGEFTIENALTLLAIQEGISSRIKYDISRGHGLIDFIEHCFLLSQDTKIAIISGQTAIKIDKNYPMSRQNIFGRERRIIALNKANDILEKPDANFIRNTGVRFNGVIIETTIPFKLNN